MTARGKSYTVLCGASKFIDLVGDVFDKVQIRADRTKGDDGRSHKHTEADTDSTE